MYKVLGKENCIFCERTKKLLKTFNIEFEYYELDTHFSLEVFKDIVLEYHRSFPAIFVGEKGLISDEDTFIGGFTELKKTVFQD